MTEFISKKIEKGFGETLKSQRKSLGLALQKVSQILNIKLAYLKALEEEDFNKLPPSVYVQGFLKSYARFLKLDAESLLKYYKMEQNIVENRKVDKKDLVYQSKIKRSPFLALSPRMLKIGFIILGVIAFFVYLGWEISGFSAAPSITIISPQDNKKINTDFVVLVGKTDKGAEVYVNGQKVVIDPEGNFREQLVLSEGLNILEILAKNKLGRERRIERKILVRLPADYHSQVSGDKRETEEAVWDQKIELIINIKDSATWISVDTDGVNVFQGTMLPNTSQIFQAEEKITLTSGKAGNTYVLFNGRDLGNLGEPGEVVRDVEFTRELEIQKNN